MQNVIAGPDDVAQVVYIGPGAEANMRRLLAGIAKVCATLAAAACNWSPIPPTPHAGVEPVLELAGDPPVSVRSVKVLAGQPEPMSRADALAGLKEALPYIQQAAKQSEAEGKTPSGSFVSTFVTEPDGMIRILMGSENRLTGGNPEGVIEGFNASTMSHKWRFPASRGQTIIEVEFGVGQL